MKGKRDSQRGKGSIELVLTLMAFIAGSIAATGSFMSASYERQRVALEQKPAIFLSCEPEYRALDIAEHLKPEPIAAFLTIRAAHWVHVAEDEKQGEAPASFARCTLTNYGRLPVLNLMLGMTLRGGSAALDVPGLAPSNKFTFSLINGTNQPMRFTFERVIVLTRVDTGTQEHAPLFLSEALVSLQNRIVEWPTR
ncbi:MAG TPA: hypothetical protein VFE17_07310 [Candidatus Baltobacteraceae bacterium]|jgi:hypothetical protein|nr:hypothetical protein [Candidatus Baltobacteraceae bacterium]